MISGNPSKGPTSGITWVWHRSRWIEPLLSAVDRQSEKRGLSQRLHTTPRPPPTEMRQAVAVPHNFKTVGIQPPFQVHFVFKKIHTIARYGITVILMRVHFDERKSGFQLPTSLAGWVGSGRFVK